MLEKIFQCQRKNKYIVICKELGIRTEILYIKSRGVYRENKKALGDNCKYIYQKNK